MKLNISAIRYSIRRVLKYPFIPVALLFAITVLLACWLTNAATNSASQISQSSSLSQKDSIKIDSLIQLAIVSDSLFEIEKSIEYYSAILEIDSLKLVALINRGRALTALGQTEKGFADYNKAIKYYPNEETYWARGMAYVITNNFEYAFPDFAAAATINPNFGKAYYGYSLVKINNKQFKHAKYWCDKADSLSYIPGLSKSIRAEIEKELNAK